MQEYCTPGAGQHTGLRQAATMQETATKNITIKHTLALCSVLQQAVMYTAAW